MTTTPTGPQAAGGSRFSHAGRIAADPVMKTMLGARRLGDPMTLTRYFGGFVQSQSEHLHKTLQTLAIQRLGSEVVICTYPGGRNVADLDIRRPAGAPWANGVRRPCSTIFRHWASIPRG